MDVPREEAFDAMTRLAARLVAVPTSFVSIVDAHRDFYLSEHGSPEDLNQARECTGRTFCHFTLRSDEALVIEDTHAYADLRAVPTVESMGVRAYVGIPLKIAGQRIGSFCVIDTQPRQWQPADIEVLQLMATSVEREIQLRMAVEQANVEAAYSLAMARSRESMVAALAHDLRTPLQILQLCLSVMERSEGRVDPIVFGRMAGAVRTMRSMADTLLADTVARPDHLLVKRKITALELAADATGMMTPIAENAGMALSLGELPDSTVEVEYAQMLRALGNLIGNGIKYAKPGSGVVLSGKRDGKMTLIEIHDDGLGMSEHELSHAFERGYQGGAGMVRGDGAGLGLSIVKELVEQNGGSVRIQSQLGHGTVVTISLPSVDGIG